MQYHAAGEECNLMKCNENVENASKCMSMHLNAYGKKQHHFREKTTLIPTKCTHYVELLSDAISSNQRPSDAISGPHLQQFTQLAR
jgi:hypothetical protein